MEVDAVALFGAEARDSGPTWVLQVSGPAAARFRDALAERGKGRETLQRGAVAIAERAKGGLFVAAASPQLFQCPHLQPENRIPIDAGTIVQCEPRRCECLQVNVCFGRPRYRRDIEVERVAPQPASRVVGARLLRSPRRDRMQGIDHRHTGSPGARPPSEASQVSYVTVAPAGARAERVELDRPTPGPQVAGQVATPG